MKLFELGVGQPGLEEAAARIAEDCKPYVQAVDVDQIVLHRGMKADGAYRYVDVVRENRMPRDSHPLAHRVADDWFRREFGIALRSKSVFTARSSNSADRFGQVHYIFPTGNDWKFYGSPDVGDFTAELNRWTANYNDQVSKLYHFKIRKGAWVNNKPPKLENKERKLYKQVILEFLNQANYQQLSASDLRTLPESNEVMMVASSYYAVNEGIHNAHNVFDYIREDLNSN